MGREAERGPDPMPRRAELTISKRTVDGLAVEGKDAVFWDRELAGFGVRVYPSGRKIYVVQSRGPGGSKRITLGRHGEFTVEQARKEAVAVIDRIKRGENPVAAPPEPRVHRGRSGTALPRDACGGELQRAHRRGSTGDRSTTTSCRHWERCRSVRSAGPRHQHCTYGLRDTPRAANRALMVLSKMFSLAEDWGLAPAGGNPCRFVRKYKEGMRERFLTPDEYRRLGRALCALDAGGPLPARAATAHCGC